MGTWGLGISIWSYYVDKKEMNKTIRDHTLYDVYLIICIFMCIDAFFVGVYVFSWFLVCIHACACTYIYIYICIYICACRHNR